MPAFDLPAKELHSLAALLHSLNAPAAESTALGDPAAGKQFFLGKGQCANCHMLFGAGRPVGPDLSNIGNEMTVEQIRVALVEPSTVIASGYELVTVKQRNGQTIRGFAKNRSNFDLALQDLESRFHSIQHSEIAAIEDEKQSLMQPVTASAQELQRLIAYLGQLTGVKLGMRAAARPARRESNSHGSWRRTLQTGSATTESSAETATANLTKSILPT